MAVAESSGNDNSPRARESLRHLVQAREGGWNRVGGQQRPAARLAVRGELWCFGLSSMRVWGLRREEVVGQEKDMGPTLRVGLT
jgi:hypothetical protein